jgi:hypothetical protein
MTMVINGSGTITGLSAGGLPDATVIQADLATGVAGTGPAFSVYLSANQSVTSNVATKVAFDTEEFDTNSNFASNRFTPTVAGYYQINATIQSNGTNTRYIYFFYKNGSAYKRFFDSTVDYGASGSITVFLNGSTDYIEVYGQITGSGTAFAGGDISYTYINGFLARAA